MKPIELAEVSAYLDGELDSTRAEEVRNAIAIDPALRSIFNGLSEADTKWRAAAAAANFHHAVRLRHLSALAVSMPVAAAIGVMLVLMRVLPKLTDALWFGLICHGILLAAIVVGLVHTERNTPSSFAKDW
jgi:anti-sigma factor RsiW